MPFILLRAFTVKVFPAIEIFFAQFEYKLIYKVLRLLIVNRQSQTSVKKEKKNIAIPKPYLLGGSPFGGRSLNCRLATVAWHI